MKKAQEEGWLLSQGDYPRLTRAMGYSRKNPDRWQVGWDVEDIDFAGVLKKEHVEIPGVN